MGLRYLNGVKYRLRVLYVADRKRKEDPVLLKRGCNFCLPLPSGQRPPPGVHNLVSLKPSHRRDKLMSLVPFSCGNFKSISCELFSETKTDHLNATREEGKSRNILC